MSGRLTIASIHARWSGIAHDLSGSDSETLRLSDLLALASSEDQGRWEQLAFGYAGALGAPWLREAVAAHYREAHADDVVCCAGAQEAIACVAAAIIERGDHAVVILPIYQPSEQAVTALCPATGVPLEAPGWQLDIDRVAAAIRPDTRFILSNFPNSPTGAVLAPDRLAALVALCRRHGLWLVNDEVYRHTARQTVEAAPPLVADIYERGISIDGLSKGFGLPGLRVGWAVCRDPALRDRIVAAKSRLSSCLSSASEVLAHIALQASVAIISRARAIGTRNQERLRQLAARCPGILALDEPANDAFSFPSLVGRGSAVELVDRIACEIGVLLMPSTNWTSSLGFVPGDHIRIGLGHARNAQALDELERFFVANAAQCL